jgi:hypothetical protein
MIEAIRGMFLLTFISFGVGFSAERPFRPDPPQPRPFSQQQCGVELVEELRVGQLDGPEEFTLVQVGGLSVGSDGSIYVLDKHASSIKQFDRTGQFVRHIGRQGEGPGEFRSLVDIGDQPNGGFSVWDYGNLRISVFDSSGVFVKGIRVPNGIYSQRAFKVDTSGNYFVKIRGGPVRITGGGMVSGSAYSYLRLTPEGQILDTLSLPVPNPPGGLATHSEEGLRLPFTRQELYVLSPLGYLVVGSNEEYSFEIRDPKGSIVVQRDDFKGIVVGREERQEWQNLARALERRRGVTSADIPDRKPAYRDLWVDSDGRIWVHKYVEAVKRDVPATRKNRSGDLEPNLSWLEPNVFDVFSKDGEFLWCAQLPRRATVQASRGNLVWGVIRGDFDEEYLVRWRLSPRESTS